MAVSKLLRSGGFEMPGGIKKAAILGLAVAVCACNAAPEGSVRPERKVQHLLPRFLTGPSQPMPEELAKLDVPKTTRHVECFKGFTAEASMLEVVKKCGVPDEHHGSGLFIFLYDTEDGSVVVAGAASLDSLAYLNHLTPRASEYLLQSSGPPKPRTEVAKTASAVLEERCRPKVVKYGKTVDKVEFRGQSYRNSPVVSFRVQESGESTHAVLERSSGVDDIDRQALAWVKGTSYNNRPGCGVIESKVSVTIDFR